jgi:hypothetical protein
MAAVALSHMVTVGTVASNSAVRTER